MTDEEIRILKDRGFVAWEKNKSKLYANPETIGLFCEYEVVNGKKRIVFALLNGEPIDPRDAAMYKHAKGYIDLSTDRIVCDHKGLERLIENAIDDTRREIRMKAEYFDGKKGQYTGDELPPYMYK